MGAGRRAGGKGGGRQISPAAGAFADRSGGNAAAMGRQFAAGSQRADQMGINPNLSPGVRALAAYTGGNAAEMGRAIGGGPQVPIQTRLGGAAGGMPQFDPYGRYRQQMQDPRRRMEAMRNQLYGGALQAPGSYMDNMPPWAQESSQRLREQYQQPDFSISPIEGGPQPWGGRQQLLPPWAQESSQRLREQYQPQPIQQHFTRQPGGQQPDFVGSQIPLDQQPGAMRPGSPGGKGGGRPSPGGKGGGRPSPGGKGGGGRRFQEGGPVSPLAPGGLGEAGGNPLVGLYDYGNVPAPAPTNWRGSELAPRESMPGAMSRAQAQPYSGPMEPAGGWGPGGPPPPPVRPPGAGTSWIPPRLPPMFERPVWREGPGSPSTQTAGTGYASTETPAFFGAGLGAGLKGYQEGGLASLMPPPGGMPPMAPGMDEMSMQMVEEGPSPMGPGMEEIGMEEISTQMPAPELGEEELVGLYMDARAALEGTHPNPEQAIAAFIDAFGEEAWIELQALAAGGSDGMSDSIPGNIDGVEEVALSEGEYVVPSDVVSGIGNGDTNSGADRLKGMVEEIRTARTGAPGMPSQVDFEEIMGQV